MNSRREDPSQMDCAWAGYDPRAALPVLVAAAIASLFVWTGRWYLASLSELTDWLGSWTVFVLGWSLWPALIAVYAYRAITYTYRVTNLALFIDYGFWHRPVSPVWLKEIVEVRAGAGWLGRWFGVGWVEVRTASRVERLTGVRNPEVFAEQIRAARDKEESAKAQ